MAGGQVNLQEVADEIRDGAPDPFTYLAPYGISEAQLNEFLAIGIPPWFSREACLAIGLAIGIRVGELAAGKTTQ